MKTFLVSVFSILIINTASSQIMMRRYWTHNVFLIQNCQLKISGTGFAGTIDSGKDNYLITARHIFSNKRSGDTLSFGLLENGRNQIHFGQIFFHQNSIIDIAIIKVNGDIKIPETFQLEDNSFIAIGADAVFLGFPYGLSTGGSVPTAIQFPWPLLKRAYLSGLDIHNGFDIMYFDGQNNPGFSGGPIIMHDNSLKKDVVVGVISGYITQIDSGKIGSQKFTYTENSGIMYGFGTPEIISIIKSIH